MSNSGLRPAVPEYNECNNYNYENQLRNPLCGAIPRILKATTRRVWRRDFLIEKVFTADEVNMVYSMYDRMVVGGAMPVAETLRLEAIDPPEGSVLPHAPRNGHLQRRRPPAW